MDTVGAKDPNATFFRWYLVAMGVWYIFGALANVAIGGEALIFGALVPGLQEIPYIAEELFVLFLLFSAVVFITLGISFKNTSDIVKVRRIKQRVIGIFSVWFILKVLIIFGNIAGLFAVVGFLLNTFLISYFLSKLERSAPSIESKKWVWVLTVSVVIAILGIAVPWYQFSQTAAAAAQQLSVTEDQNGLVVPDASHAGPSQISGSSIVIPSRGQLLLQDGQTAVGYVDGLTIDLVNASDTPMLYVNGIQVVDSTSTSATNIQGVFFLDGYAWYIGEPGCASGKTISDNTCDVSISVFNLQPYGKPEGTILFGIGQHVKNGSQDEWLD